MRCVRAICRQYAGQFDKRKKVHETRALSCARAVTHRKQFLEANEPTSGDNPFDAPWTNQKPYPRVRSETNHDTESLTESANGARPGWHFRRAILRAMEFRHVARFLTKRYKRSYCCLAEWITSFPLWPAAMGVVYLRPRSNVGDRARATRIGRSKGPFTSARKIFSELELTRIIWTGLLLTGYRETLANDQVYWLLLSFLYILNQFYFAWNNSWIFVLLVRWVVFMKCSEKRTKEEIKKLRLSFF